MRFAFDVDNARLSHGHTGGDARRPPEAVRSHLEDGQPIDLSDFLPINIDKNRPLCNQLADFLFDAIRPKDAFVQRLLHVLR